MVGEVLLGYGEAKIVFYSSDSVLTVEPMKSKRWLMRRNTRTNAARLEMVQDLRDLIASAVDSKRTVVPRGAGHSYDAVRNANGMTLDLSLFRHVLDWSPEQGIIQVQPGVTIDELWRIVVGDGWWPEVLPSRLEATIGGCLAVNTIGANAWHTGSIGEYVQAF